MASVSLKEETSELSVFTCLWICLAHSRRLVNGSLFLFPSFLSLAFMMLLLTAFLQTKFLTAIAT